jgi:zinc protease
MRTTERKSLRAGALLTCAALLATSAVTSLAQEQTTPPAPSAPRSVKFPTPAERTLKNGLRVVVVEKHDVPVVAAELTFKSGAEVDPATLAGLADFTAELVNKGTKKRSAPEIAEAVEALGGQLDASAGFDSSSISVAAMSSKIDPLFEIFADVARNPTFKDDEIERYRQQVLDDLTVAFSRPGTLATYVGMRVLYGDSPYGHPASGTPESIARIKRDDIVKLHETYYRPDNAVLVIGGDITLEAGVKLAEKYFGDWAKPASALPAAPASAGTVEKGLKRRVVVVDKPDAGQAAVMLIRPGLKRADKDYYTAVVANSILGGSYSSRLNQEIRIKRGLSYGARSTLDLRRDVGPFYAMTQTKNESGAEVASLLASELQRLADAPIPNDELTPRKATLSGGFARGLETIAGLVSRVSSYALYGLPLNLADEFISSVDKVSETSVRTFVGSRIGAKDASIVIVGNASAFLPALKKEFPNVEVIPASELDLNSASLRAAKAAQSGGK